MSKRWIALALAAAFAALATLLLRDAHADARREAATVNDSRIIPAGALEEKT